jgi:hypothetical protein
MEMPDETKEMLSKRKAGRPANAIRNHEYGSPIQRKEKLDRLCGLKKSGGLTCLKRYYSGELLNPRQAIRGMCCECLGFYADGLADCECQLCPLYHYMPYRRKDAK